jgi:hypothetical protein
LKFAIIRQHYTPIGGIARVLERASATPRTDHVDIAHAVVDYPCRETHPLDNRAIARIAHRIAELYGVAAGECAA